MVFISFSIRNNVEGLYVVADQSPSLRFIKLTTTIRMNISHKLVVPSLQQACLNFLLSHAAGRPIKAMRIAELFEEDELYRESSRFVLDNPDGW